MDNEEVVSQLEESDALFVLGGDTRYLLDVIRSRKLVDAFLNAFSAGTVFAGTSAGLIWFSRWCMSDSESFHKEFWNYITLDGLGVLPFGINAHDDGGVPEGIIDNRSRKDQFEAQFLENNGVRGLAVDEMVGIEIIDGNLKVQTASPRKGAYILSKQDDEFVREKVLGEHFVEYNLNLSHP